MNISKISTKWNLGFVLVFFTPFSIAITSLGEERTVLCFFYLSCVCLFCMCWFVSVFPLPFGVRNWLQLEIVALPGLFFLPFFNGTCHFK